MKLYDELLERGLIESISSKDLIQKINDGGIKFYIGTDPTGDSLHIGHFSSILMAERLKRGGHIPYLLIGGGTGLIGDPKVTGERDVISYEKLNYNTEALTKQARDIFGFKIVNNYDWLKDINFIDYLRDYGKCFNLNYMLDKETVKSRLETGISYTEFSYMIMQSIDFLKLYENEGITMQIGGQDQWGNITSGLELIRKKHPDAECFALTMPLITRADGTKFGKSESGKALWLDINKTSSYEWYQYLINTEDEKVIEYIKKLTFMPLDKIKELEEQHKLEPHKRIAQKTLAKEVITYLFKEEEYNKAIQISETLFSGEINKLSEEQIEEVVKTFEVKQIQNNLNIVDILVNTQICSSKREAKEMINSSAISLNGEKITNEEKIITQECTMFNKYLIIRKGKKNYFVLEFEN